MFQASLGGAGHRMVGFHAGIILFKQWPIIKRERERDRGQWAVWYTSPQSFILKFSFLFIGLKTYETFNGFWLVGLLSLEFNGNLQ